MLKKLFIAYSCLCCIGFFLGIQSCTDPNQVPDILITNAVIWTDGKIQDLDAIAIKNDRILALGKSSDLINSATKHTKQLDAKHGLICPGFIDAHVHFLQGGFNLSSVQLRDAATPKEFINRIKTFIQTVPKETWITGGDWNHELWGGNLPDKEWIDSISPDHPVALNRLDGHMILCNSKALSLAGITNDVKEVPGGEIPRNRKNVIMGIFKDNAADLIYSKIPPVDALAEDRALDAAMNYVASHGVTGIHHMGSFRDLEVFNRNKSRLITRIYAATPLSQWSILKSFIDQFGRGDSLLHWGMLKGFMDGSLGSHTAAMIEDFTDKPGDKGFLVNPLDSMSKWIEDADRAGLHIAVHAIGDKAISNLIDQFSRINTLNSKKERRWRIEHTQHPVAADFHRMSQLDIIASMQPYHAIDDGCWAEKVIGSERIKTTYAFQSLLTDGVKLAFGSDWFVAPPIPMLGIYAAVTRQTLDGKNPNGWVPEQKITLDQALTAYTSGAAYAGFEEGYLGSIKPGNLADLVMLDRNLHTLAPDSLNQVKVKWTMVGGRFTYSKNPE